MYSRNAIVCALVAAAGTTASAGVFTWVGGNNGMWDDHANWAGPAAQYPHLTLDSATVSGDSSSAQLTGSTSLGLLNILGGASVYSSNNSLFIAGDANILGGGSSLSVTNTPSLRDVDVDNLTVSDGVVAFYGGLMQVDESAVVNGAQGGAILGVGTVEMNSTSGDLVVERGAVWAMGSGLPEATLLLDRTGSSTSRLDWTSPDCSMIVWEGKTLHNRLPYTGSLGGRIQVSNSSGATSFVSDHPFIAAPSSEIVLSGNGNQAARVTGPVIDSYGEVRATGRGVIEAPFLALRGTGSIAEDTRLDFDSGSMILDSFSFAATGTGSDVRFTAPGSAVSVTGGTTTFDLGETGSFDLDGTGNREITVADGSALEILSGRVDTGTEVFGGTLNLAGDLHIEYYGWPQPGWQSAGTIEMQGGSYTGRRFINSGEISGSGSIDTTVHNDGLVEAIGGSLVFEHLVPGGTVEIPGAGVTRAEQGDIVITRQDLGGYLPVGGSIFVGNGQGAREVFEMNEGMIVGDYGDDVGMLSMNGGFARFGRIRLGSQFSSAGDSVVTISGSDEHDAIEFIGGNATVDGTLEVRGNTIVWDEGQLSGGGTIYGASTVKRIAIMDGASTGNVAIDAAGGVELGAYGQDAAQGATAAMTMRPTASLGVDIAGDAASGEFDALQVAGDAAIDGTLIVRWSADLGDAPVGETYTVLTAGSVSGEFDGVDFSELGTNRRAHVTVNPGSIEVLVTCLTDMNGDGILDLNDISSFVDAFTSGDMLADVSPPQGILDLNDLNAFVFFFQGGCN